MSHKNRQSGSALGRLGKPGQAAQRFGELLSQQNWAVLGIGLNDLQPVVELYGDDWRRQALELVAECLFSSRETHGHAGDLLIRLTAETFLVITQASSAARWKEGLQSRFRENLLSTLPPAHLHDGMICPSPSRRLPMPTLAVGVVTDQDGPFSNPRHLLERVAKARSQNERSALLFGLNSLTVTAGRLQEEIRVREHAPNLVPLLEHFAQVTTGPIHDLRNGLNILYEEARKISNLLSDTTRGQALVSATRYCRFLLETCSELRFRGVGAPHRVDLSQLLRENTFLWSRRIAAYIAVDAPSEAVEVYADGSQVTQALFNLLSWLVGQTEDCDHISVTCRSSVGQGEIVITGNFDLGMDQKNLLKYSLVELQNEQRPMLYVFQKLIARYSGRVQFEPGRISLGFPRYRWQDVRSADMLVEQIRRLEVEIEELEARLAKVMPERDERVGDFSLKEVIGLAGEIVARLVDEFDQIRQQATRQRQEADENQTTLWESCEAGSHFCQLLAANLLALEGECIPSPRATDVGGVLESVRRMLRSKIEGIAELEWNVEADLSPVKAAETVLAQVLLNLALNSLEELARVRPSISRLSFAARETAGAIQIDISDTGEGLPAEVVERLFKEAISTRRHVEGGIGLQVVRSILDDLGGDIEFHSTAGQGTRASITLPIWEGSQ